MELGDPTVQVVTNGDDRVPSVGRGTLCDPVELRQDAAMKLIDNIAAGRVEGPLIAGLQNGMHKLNVLLTGSR
jgi:hypothetical protein